MKTYLAIFLVSLSAALFITPVIRSLTQRLGWLDMPGEVRRIHNVPVPRVGGIAIYVSVMLALSLLLLINNPVTQSLSTRRHHLVAVLVSSTLVFLFGLYDDLFGAKPGWKFMVQTVAAVVLYTLGGRIEAVTVPFAGSVAISPPVGFMFTVLWAVGVSNAFNLIDGIDGLAAGASFFAALVMVCASLVNFHPDVTVVAVALTGALIGFLRYNFNPASIFLGDSGSLFVGFLLASLSVAGTQKASTAVAVVIPLMAFALPVIDTGFAIARRLVSHKPLFEGDREHIHHKLLNRGWSQRRVTFTLYGASAFFGLLALLSVRDGGDGGITGLVLVITGSAVVLIGGRLRHRKLGEVPD